MRKEELVDNVIDVIISHYFSPTYDVNNMIDVTDDREVCYKITYFGCDAIKYKFEDCYRLSNSIILYLLYNVDTEKYDILLSNPYMIMLRKTMLTESKDFDNIHRYISDVINRFTTVKLKDKLIDKLVNLLKDNQVFAVKEHNNILSNIRFNVVNRTISFFDFNLLAKMEYKTKEQVIHALVRICLCDKANKEDVFVRIKMERRNIFDNYLQSMSILDERLRKFSGIVV